jgi:uncharacterized membrane protein (UPF0127 family)
MVTCYIPITDIEREQGLLGFSKGSLTDNEGMLFLPPSRLTTRGMKFPIDIIETVPQTNLFPGDQIFILSKTEMIPEGVTLQESFNVLIELAGGWCARNL